MTFCAADRRRDEAPAEASPPAMYGRGDYFAGFSSTLIQPGWRWSKAL